LGIVHKRNKQMTTALQKFIELLQHDTAAPRHELAQNVRQSNGHALNGRSTLRPARQKMIAGRRSKSKPT
jgi:hypothetical protein